MFYALTLLVFSLLGRSTRKYSVALGVLRVFSCVVSSIITFILFQSTINLGNHLCLDVYNIRGLCNEQVLVSSGLVVTALEIMMFGLDMTVKFGYTTFYRALLTVAFGLALTFHEFLNVIVAVAVGVCFLIHCYCLATRRTNVLWSRDDNFMKGEKPTVTTHREDEQPSLGKRRPIYKLKPNQFEFVWDLVSEVRMELPLIGRSRDQANQLAVTKCISRKLSTTTIRMNDRVWFANCVFFYYWVEDVFTQDLQSSLAEAEARGYLYESRA